jgi:2-oxo-4-hydroxy-4-carboxy-5-ureidoimidazoline decarboxylase
MSAVLDRWNCLPHEEASEALLCSCGSHAWAEIMVRKRPYSSVSELLENSDRVWEGLSTDDWLEAFRCHPRIGAVSARDASEGSLALSKEEQGQVLDSSREVLERMAEGNRLYEKQFGFTFIVCATGKSADEILNLLYERLDQEPQVEIRDAAEQQRRITQIRLKKWLEI